MRGMKRGSLFFGFLTAAAGCIFIGMTALADGDRFAGSSTYRDENGNICVDFDEVQVYLPSDWSGKCQMSPSGDEVAFYQTKSRKLYTEELGFPNGGWLFSLAYSDELDFLDLPSYSVLGNADGGTYYIVYPTDVQGYVENSEAMSEYCSMNEDIPWIETNICLANEDESIDFFTDSEYILPLSSTSYLTEDDISDMDADELQMAINEIYARHNRKFVLPEVQSYFNSRSWYDGFIEAEDFDVSVMNAYEGANISLLADRLNKVKANPQIITVPESDTKDCYGMIIEAGDGYFRVRQEDGSVIQFWYEYADLDDMGIAANQLKTGAITSLIYDAESYQALEILIF